MRSLIINHALIIRILTDAQAVIVVTCLDTSAIAAVMMVFDIILLTVIAAEVNAAMIVVMAAVIGAEGGDLKRIDV